MPPIQRATFVVVNPSESAEAANLVFAIRQDPGAAAGSRPTTPRPGGVPDGQVAAPGAPVQPATLAADRAALQTRLPRAGRRTAVAASLITAGGISGATSFGILTYSIVSNGIGRAQSRSNPQSVPFPRGAESNALFSQILGAMGTGVMAASCIGAGVAVLGRRSGDAPAGGEAQTGLPVRSRCNPRVSVALHEIVVEPNVVDAAASGSQQAASNPPIPRWDAAAASMQLPFHDGHD